ncbi:MAG: Ig-like domain-containing protein [Oscillospiraceae bacterium]|nr:Ig-like domain-containing protein [Oscillospiraceae bacterium]
MKNRIRFLCLLLCAALLLPCAGVSAQDAAYHFEADFSQESLGEVIERYLDSLSINKNSIAIGWCDIMSGEEWYLNGDTFMEGASTYKLPLAMVYADRIAAGEITANDKVAHYVLRKALEVMIIDSNNAVGEKLRDNLSRNYAEYRAMLVPNSGLSEEELPEIFFRFNQFSPRFMIGTLRTLWENEERYEMILDFLKQARPDDYFSEYRGDCEVAHKYGSDEGYVCDSGIIYAPRPFLLTVMTYSVLDAKRVLGEIARIAMDYAEYLTETEGPMPEKEPPEESAEPIDPSLTLPAMGADGVREIRSADELRAIVLDPAGQYRLAADIDLAGVDWKPIPFSGTLDGAGHTIYNLTLRRLGDETVECRDGNNKPRDAQFAGLFSVAREAAIRDLRLRGVHAELESADSCFVAALAGYAYDLTAENVGVEGRLWLYGRGEILGVGGLIGFGSGWFTDCSTDVELFFEDCNAGIHCEQFLGGLAASGKFSAERCSVNIRGWASVNGFVHTGGMVGMYCGYGLVRERMMSVTDCTVKGTISFFENNFTRRAYCRGFAGEQVDLVINLRNDVSGFKRDERFRYDVVLSPEGCDEPDYVETVVEPDCTSWGWTEHVCEGCGYSWIDSYTPPRHTPGEWETVREAAPGEEGEAVLRCAVCGEELERTAIPALELPPPAPESLTLDAQVLYMKRGASETLTASLLPETAAPCALVWSSSDETVAAVSADGTVTAVGKGEAIITCASEDGTLSAACAVTVSYTFRQRLSELFGGAKGA